MQYTKAVRAVFMLVPVFGLHFLFTIYRIPSFAHQILNLVLDGIQGLVVALIVCYTNRTILKGFKKWVHTKLEQRKLRRQSEVTISHFRRSIENSETAAESFSLVNRNGISSTKKTKQKRSLDTIVTTSSCNNNESAKMKKIVSTVKLASIADDLV
uniref:G-protein coupled receptors family 2 profile 2 domain-containing protein n=1 Tax=Acrobeloides nanus TaxID=290746 RepID=A0A914EGI3_9BILA